VNKDNYHLYDDMIAWRINGKERTLIEKQLSKEEIMVPEELSHTHLFNYTITLDNKFIGWVAAIFLPKVGKANRKGYLFVDELWIQDEYRGLGYARALMGKVDELAGELNVTGIRLGVNINNPGALKLYETCGYHSTGQAYTMEKC
jgi:ribosomal protein S18 acetylase RimI-like enzyme